MCKTSKKIALDAEQHILDLAEKIKLDRMYRSQLKSAQQALQTTVDAIQSEVESVRFLELRVGLLRTDAHQSTQCIPLNTGMAEEHLLLTLQQIKESLK